MDDKGICFSLMMTPCFRLGILNSGFQIGLDIDRSPRQIKVGTAEWALWGRFSLSRYLGSWVPWSCRLILGHPIAPGHRFDLKCTATHRGNLNRRILGGSAPVRLRGGAVTFESMVHGWVLTGRIVTTSTIIITGAGRT